ncbi:fatty acid cis/trans isomerase [Pseudomonas chlororaphis]|uniref:fatty acid cis/trans isomerase n=1 Tax=Pseudomonas chlororaphis TaxID=587753 RepID=UPI0006A65739|nr:fatty acid cis/trans isomerase [Pseudomonas chlororaphis]AZD03076.1 cis/trans isomerase [Pseudomonas chlororaphis subsp. chlororaphis]MBM0282788.1 fatty acid cis/trans isomerase [Pseudomonas chlororaphis]MDO1506578.1 fatty acid cis/trans isomerase [Pseudomonas chlororaphis]ORM45681.1 peptidylprolyl isomerase [Pseudomonas chlororaphis subsp. chlororaphis]TWR91773.1 fatty acid cis/trans isomerase [Pseudomonas chlororaphis subsp. chlororaphis]
MSYRVVIGSVLLLLSSLASAQGPAPAISYTRDIQPIFTEKCVACHACYDSACQLNLGSGEGAARGASKIPVYDGERSKAQTPTRLFYDASGKHAWQGMGFYSVLDAQGSQAALMARMLELGHKTPLQPNAKLPDNIVLGLNRENMCAQPAEFDGYARAHPREGMPLAVTGLTDQQYQTLQRWLASGAPIDEQGLAPSAREAMQVLQWENLLNAPGARESLVARWLFEHWFLAHIYFEGGEPGHFFQWVRSRTPSGQPIDLINTRRPNDDPGTQVYYRLWPVQGAIVHKTHITYPLSAAKMARIKTLFYSGDYQVTALPGYGPGRRANPFETFEAIPAKARYQFMLDNAEYFVRTFIRGPVCRGQIATDVIRDNFWALFQAPEHDLYITDPAYRGQATPLLAMPGQNDDVGSVLSLWLAYRDKRNEYEVLRRDSYADAPPPSWPTLWAGNDNALLSIFRHFDSASVTKGLIGEVPQTMWLFDYPLLERTYYQLAVNFDVFGNVSHQAQTRLYFDLIRNGAEQNFLRLMPAGTREDFLDDWYQNSGKFKMWLDYESIDDDKASALVLDEKDPKRDFANQLLNRYGDLNARPDPINRCDGAYCSRPNIDPALQNAEQALSGLVSRPAAGMRVIDLLPEATMLRIQAPSGKRVFYSMLRNRAHSNVAFLLGESLRYQPGLDTLTIYPGVLSSYPNFMFNIPARQVPEFVAEMENAKDAHRFEKIVERWGIRRSHPQFWQYFHDQTQYILETDPKEAGVLDMNRYENL